MSCPHIPFSVFRLLRVTLCWRGRKNQNVEQNPGIRDKFILSENFTFFHSFHQSVVRLNLEVNSAFSVTHDDGFLDFNRTLGMIFIIKNNTDLFIPSCFLKYLLGFLYR